jgi:hypothetical protein
VLFYVSIIVFSSKMIGTNTRFSFVWATIIEITFVYIVGNSSLSTRTNQKYSQISGQRTLGHFDRFGNNKIIKIILKKFLSNHKYNNDLDLVYMMPLASPVLAHPPLPGNR